MPREEKGNFWQRLSTGEKLMTVIAFLTLIAATLVVPEARYLLHLEKHPAEQVETPPASPPAPSSKTASPLEQHEPEENAPRLKYIPYNGSPSRKDPNGVLVSSIPKEGEKGQTVKLKNGEQVGILTQRDWESLLVDQNYLAGLTPGKKPVDVFAGIDKAGDVKQAHVISADDAVAEKAKEEIKNWKFKPFVLNGQEVSVQTVIRLDSSAATTAAAGHAAASSAGVN